MKNQEQFRFSNIYYKKCPYCGSKNVNNIGSAGSDMFSTTTNLQCQDCDKFYEVEE
jgi:transposase-like protein